MEAVLGHDYKSIPLNLQILSRLKPAASKSSAPKDAQSKKQMPKLEKFLEDRDYTGAITLLEVSIFVFLNFLLFFALFALLKFILTDIKFLLSLIGAVEREQMRPMNGLAFVPFIWGITSLLF